MKVGSDWRMASHVSFPVRLRQVPNQMLRSSDDQSKADTSSLWVSAGARPCGTLTAKGYSYAAAAQAG